MNDKKMMNRFVKNLKVCSDFLDLILPSEDKKDSVKLYEIVEQDKRHVYEDKYQDIVFEAITKFGTESKSNNSFDSFIIGSHPEDDRFRLMAVADGCGFVADSKTKRILPSGKCVTNEIGNWFNNLSISELERFNISNFNNSLNMRLEKLHDKFKATRGDHGTKIVLALVGPNFTYIANLGDLRCYIEKDYTIVQFNEEDSSLWEDYRNGFFWNKEEFRFRNKKNKNVARLGVDQPHFSSSYLLDNESYDRIYLFSRGVIECLSEEKLSIINADKSPNRVVESIIDISTNGQVESMEYFEGNSKEISKVVHGAKDATACVYMKKRK